MCEGREGVNSSAPHSCTKVLSVFRSSRSDRFCGTRAGVSGMLCVLDSDSPRSGPVGTSYAKYFRLMCASQMDPAPVQKYTRRGIYGGQDGTEGREAAGEEEGDRCPAGGAEAPLQRGRDPADHGGSAGPGPGRHQQPAGRDAAGDRLRGKIQCGKVQPPECPGEPEGPCQDLLPAGKDPDHQFLPDQRHALFRGSAGIRLREREPGCKSGLGQDDRELSPQIDTAEGGVPSGGHPPRAVGQRLHDVRLDQGSGTPYSGGGHEAGQDKAEPDGEAEEADPGDPGTSGHGTGDPVFRRDKTRQRRDLL